MPRRVWSSSSSAKAPSERAVTEEEIKTIVAEVETAGVIETDERKMISGVLRLGDRAVHGIMTPRTDVDWIDLDDSEAEIRERLVRTTHSRLPVAEGDPGNMLGVVQAWEILAAMLKDEPLDIRSHIRKAPIIPDTPEIAVSRQMFADILSLIARLALGNLVRFVLLPDQRHDSVGRSYHRPRFNTARVIVGR
jgi:CBS domain containing-hemolysin-like protein